MKKLINLLLCLLLSALLLSACGGRRGEGGAPAPGDSPEEAEDMEEPTDTEDSSEEDETQENKLHYYQVLNAQGEELYTVTNSTQVETLDKLLDGIGREDTETKSYPLAESDIACIYICRQEKTRLAGQNGEAEPGYEEILRFIIHRNEDLVTVRILDGHGGGEILDGLLTFTDAVPEEIMEALRDPAQFTEA